MSAMTSSTADASAAALAHEAVPWPVRLFRRSVLKQQKYRAITGLLGSTAGRRCLDLGSDNGVVSYLLRQGGGDWASADLDPAAVASIRALVDTDVHTLDGGRTPFRDDEFDCVVVVDLLEHLEEDRRFVGELHRILRPGGILIANVPYPHDGLLRRLRDALGQTDQVHGHLRPGYTLESLSGLLGGRFTVDRAQRYSGFFAEATDALLVWGLGRLKGAKQESTKGVLVGEANLRRHARLFRAYSLIYPFVWGMSQIDRLVWWQPGYMLIARATADKPASVALDSRPFTVKGST
jgi:SAM-dependent methyltransferase